MGSNKQSPPDLTRLLALVERQAAQIDALVAQRRPKIAAAPAEPCDDLTWAKLWALYSPSIAANSWFHRVESVMKTALEYFGPKRVLDTKRSDWRHYVDQVALKRVTLRGGPPSPTTVNIELVRLRAACNWAINEELIDRNPLQGVKPMKGSNRRDTIISDDQIEVLLKHCCPWMRAMVIVAVDSGMRRDEIRLLRWEEIDFERCLVNLGWQRTKAKKARSPRLSERALAAVRGLIRVAGNPYVFVNPDTGRPWSTTMVNNIWVAAVKAAGLKPAAGDGSVHFHDLRRTAVTRMVKLGVPLLVSMRAVGHSSASEQWRYLTVDDGQLDDMRRKIDESVQGRVAS